MASDGNRTGCGRAIGSVSVGFDLFLRHEAHQIHRRHDSPKLPVFHDWDAVNVTFEKEPCNVADGVVGRYGDALGAHPS